jgi:hypothetical protein
MPKPIITDDLFKISDKFSPYMVGDDIIIIDNVYQNFDQIVDILQNGIAPSWKISETSRNFKDYYDCRPCMPIWFNMKNTNFFIDTICDLIKSFYGANDIRCLNKDMREFNMFKHINLPDQTKNMQFFPHRDTKFTGITTFDSICSGGTAIYDIDFQPLHNERENLFYDVTHLPRRVIESNPNSMIIFRSTQYHGGYIEDHKKYLNDWRINEVLFFN